MEVVTDADDPRLDDYRHLRDPSRRQRLEADRGILVAEGTHAIRALVASPFPVRSLLVADYRVPAAADLVDGTGIRVYSAPLELLRSFVGFNVHRGLLAAADRLPPRDPRDVIAAASSLAVLEGVNDHENLGALFRNAAAFGVAGVLLDVTCSDPLYRRAIRVSSGHALLVPFARWDPWPDGFDRLRAAGFTTIALTPGPDSVAVNDLTRPAKPAVIVGSEGPGLRGRTLAAADHRVRIPMAAGVDSLNVATAAAVAFNRLLG